MILQVETTTHCNLKCVECPHRLMKRPQQHMTMEVFQRILSMLVVDLEFESVTLNKDGEPLLHPKLEEMIEGLCTASKSRIDIYTNGLLLKRDLVRWLGNFDNKFRILLTYHFFNFDGTENDYGEVTPVLIECIRTAPENVTFILASHSTSMVSGEKLAKWKNEWTSRKEALPRLDAVHANANINPWTGLISDPNCVTYDQCIYGGFSHVFVGVTGDILPCCMDLEEELSMGNVMDLETDELMNLLSEFHKKMADGIIENGVCRRCITG